MAPFEIGPWMERTDTIALNLEGTDRWSEHDRDVCVGIELTPAQAHQLATQLLEQVAHANTTNIGGEAA